MRRAIALMSLLVVAAWPLLAQTPSVPYKIDFDSSRDVETFDQPNPGGRPILMVKAKFSISVDGASTDPPGTIYKVVIEENGKPVKEVAVPQPAASDDLSVVLAIDTSGSMREHGRMEQARIAANTFLDRLPSKADCGLILFDHEVLLPTVPPTLEREPLRAAIKGAKPRGGTAYLDAAMAGIDMLAKLPANREKALVIMTDGLDLNSQKSVEAVIDQARKHRIRIYTIGIGEPGKLETVSTALVLDHSGSMTPPASEEDATPKIKAMHKAAARFVGIMPSTGRATLVPFSSAVDRITPFSNEKFLLKNEIEKLSAYGETALFDATYAGIVALQADGAKGKRVVVAMTDGVDNSSRRRVEEVIDEAKQAGIPLFLLGFGRKGELDEATMEHMAKSTGGKYYPARNERDLIEIFENLSIDIHDDGIDEIVLTRLADKTGGKYYPAKDVKRLEFVLGQVAQSIQRKSYEEVFASLNQVRDGSLRRVGIKLLRGNDQVSNTAGGDFKVVGVEGGQGGYQVTGVVVAEMSYLVYLGLLLVIGVLIALPSWLKKLAPRT